jgi:hypothetical protein
MNALEIRNKLPIKNGSALSELSECPLHRKTPFGITNVRMTQFSIARFYGGIKFNGDAFTYLPDTDELIRDDVLRWRLEGLSQKILLTA